MLGAIAGDIIGSVHEFQAQKSMDFPLFDEASRFTDDSVLTIAVADCLLTGSSYVDKFHAYAADYEEAIRLATSLGGDADTLACIAGGIAEAFYGGVPSHISAFALAKLDDTLRHTVVAFRDRYGAAGG